MPHVPPEDVISPKDSWRLVDVVLDNGEGEAAYAIGMWEKKRCVAFRWNGTDERPIGNPQSRGLPTWVILDTPLNRSVLKLVQKQNAEKAPIMRAFLGLPVEPEYRVI